MGLSRQFWKDLDLIGNTHGNPFRAAGQETIIESFALSQAVAVFRKGRTRNKDKVNILRADDLDRLLRSTDAIHILCQFL